MNKYNDEVLHNMISRCEGRDWVNTGSTTNCHDSMFKKTKMFIEEPKKMLEHGKVDSWHINFVGGWDNISDMFRYYGSIGEVFCKDLMAYAFDVATDEQLKDFALYATYQNVREEAALRYCEKHANERYLPTRLEGGYMKQACFIAA